MPFISHSVFGYSTGQNLLLQCALQEAFNADTTFELIRSELDPHPLQILCFLKIFTWWFTFTFHK
jgi:hypothetical protein